MPATPHFCPLSIARGLRRPSDPACMPPLRLPCAPSRPRPTFARPRWRRAGSRPSLRETGSARSPCALWPRGNFWPIPCAMSFCMRWWSARPDRRLRSGCAKDWSKRGAKQPARQQTAFGQAHAHNRRNATPLSRIHASEAESEAAHRAAAWYAAQLLTRYGRAQVLDWLRSDVPAGVVATLGQR